MAGLNIGGAYQRVASSVSNISGKHSLINPLTQKKKHIQSKVSFSYFTSSEFLLKLEVYIQFIPLRFIHLSSRSCGLLPRTSPFATNAMSPGTEVSDYCDIFEP